MSYFEKRQRIAQGLEAPTAKKAPGRKKIDPSEDQPDLDQWFKDRDREATGKCRHCGGRTCKGDPLYYKHSIAHLLPKRLFPSVAAHPDNWIELCFWEKNCHGNLDAGTLDLIDLHCFDEVIEKFVKIYPSIAPKERRHIPDVLLQYVEANK